jgi:hypothetical protein
MLAVNLFGRVLRSTHDYVGFMKTDEAVDLLNKSVQTIGDALDAIDKAHSFTSLPMDKIWFERGEESKERDFYLDSNPTDPFVDLYAYAKALKIHKNWTPLLEGDWKLKGDYLLLNREIICDSFNFKRMTLDDFINHCTKQGIECVIHPEFEIR